MSNLYVVLEHGETFINDGRGGYTEPFVKVIGILGEAEAKELVETMNKELQGRKFYRSVEKFESTQIKRFSYERAYLILSIDEVVKRYRQLRSK